MHIQLVELRLCRTYRHLLVFAGTSLPLFLVRSSVCFSLRLSLGCWTPSGLDWDWARDYAVLLGVHAVVVDAPAVSFDVAGVAGLTEYKPSLFHSFNC